MGWSFISLAHAAPDIIGHRQNSMEQLEALAEAGLKYAEVDVQLSPDGRVILSHSNDLKNLDRAPPLKDVLAHFKGLTFVIDFKSLPAEVLVTAVAKVVDQSNAWGRVIFYSTNSAHMRFLETLQPQAVQFEDRRVTRLRLENFLASHHKTCAPTSSAPWIGFEVERKMKVTETFKLGEESDEVVFTMWTPDSMRCTKSRAPQAKIVWFGVNSIDMYKQAEKAGVDAVFVDDPKVLLSAKGEVRSK